MKKILKVFSLVLLALLIIGVISSLSENKDKIKEEIDTAKEDFVTKEEFEAVEMGMSYDEVVEIIGFDGQLQSEVNIGTGTEYLTQLYTWSNPLGSNMNVTFQDGKAVSKAQAGLF